MIGLYWYIIYMNNWYYINNSSIIKTIKRSKYFFQEKTV